MKEKDTATVCISLNDKETLLLNLWRNLSQEACALNNQIMKYRLKFANKLNGDEAEVMRRRPCRTNSNTPKMVRLLPLAKATNITTA
ncbi:MAG: hypothetical protein ACI308_08275 [Muribaculaceae bacterium]